MDGEKEIGRAWLNVIIENGSIQAGLKYYGLLGDVFIDESYRKCGLAKELVREVVEWAGELRCTKLLALSREENTVAHSLYEKLGFTKHGFEFRLDL